ncbi:MAG TPA: argininosuccinate lyase [Terrimicrobiaceae bacterium]|nr:argininosuccinate lyase [Terrimicrobiaceae bacterium]
MWKGRFQQSASDLLQSYSESVSFDWRLFRQDIRGSIAHARALVAAGILTDAEFAAIAGGLREIEDDIAAGRFEFRMELEDVHMNIESELTRRIGAAGAKLHTARSRNDQVALDLRLYLRDEIAEICRLLRSFQRALVDLAERHPAAVLPGYTHLQRAQPVFAAHHVLAYVEMAERDHGRLRDGAARMDRMPLGSGAIAGSTIVLDREAVARELGFSGVTQNSMDAVSDRDFACELLAALAILGMHLSRLGEDIILWASAEFGFIELSDRHTTGSSLMPQKKNPDIAELTRGKTGRLYGNLIALLTTMKGLPLTYNRDMQEDKEPVFDSIDTVKAALAIFAEMIDGASFREARGAEAASDPNLLATDLADRLVLGGVPFRSAHEIVGKLVALAGAKQRPLHQLDPSDYAAASPVLTPEVIAATFDVASGLAARQAPGAPSARNVAARIAHWKSILQ